MATHEKTHGNEVSCRPLQSIFQFLRDRQIPAEAVFGGASYAIDYMRNPNNRISWSELVKCLARLSDVSGGQSGLEAVGELSPGSMEFTQLNKLLGFFADSRLGYWGLMKLMPSFFRNVRFQFIDSGSRRIRIIMEIPEEYEDCPAFFMIWVGGLRSTPRVYAQPNSVVHLAITERKGVFDIVLPPSATIFSRIRRALRVLFAARAVIEEISSQDRAIRQTQQALVDSQMNLQLATQMSALSKLAALGDMAGGVAHEINNPLTIIGLTAANAREKLKDESVSRQAIADQLALIERTVERMARIVSSMRAFARDAENDPFTFVPVRTIIEDTLNLCREKFKSRGVDLQIRPIDADLTLECRSTQISQVLLNLLSNALDAASTSSEKWVRIEITEVGTYIRFAVIDSGSGVPPAARARIFEPFFSLKPVDKGTGLGLSTAVGVVSSHRGTLTLDPATPHTCFVALIPQKRVA